MHTVYDIFRCFDKVFLIYQPSDVNLQDKQRSSMKNNLTILNTHKDTDTDLNLQHTHTHTHTRTHMHKMYSSQTHAHTRSYIPTYKHKGTCVHTPDEMISKFG